MIHHLTRATRHLIFWSLLAVAISLTGVRLLLTGIENYKVELGDNISRLIGTPVTIGRLGAKMRGFSPELVLKDIAIASVSANDQSAIQLKEIRLGINLLNILVSRELMSSAWITLVGAKLSVYRKADGSFAVMGLKTGDGQPLWLFQGGKFEVLRSEIIWRDEQRQANPLKLEAVDLAIINDAQRHKINLLAKLPDYYGQAITVAMDFVGNAFAPSAINGTVYLEGKHLRLDRLAMGGLPQGIAVNAGYADLKVWNQLRDSQWVAMTAEARFDDIKLLRTGKDPLAFKSLKTGFHWHQNAVTRLWQLDVSHFLLETTDHKNTLKHWPDAVFSVSLRHKDNTDMPEMALFIKQLDIEEVSRIGGFLAPDSAQIVPLLAQANAKGRLERFSIFADWDQKRVAVNGKFSAVSFSPFATMPGIENVSGGIQGTDEQGLIRLATENAEIKMPEIFREPLLIKSLRGAIAWRQNQNDWWLSSRQINLNVPGLQSESFFNLSIPKQHELPFLDLQTALVCDDASQLKHYYPTGIMKPADINWLDKAFVRGRINKGQLLYYGKLGQFPVNHTTVADVKREQAAADPALKAFMHEPPDIPPQAEGVHRVQARELANGSLFEAILDIAELELDYAPDWPHINDIAGQLVFLQNRMEVNAYQGYSGRLKATRAVVINPSVGLSKEMLVQGDVEGEIAQVLDFLKHTPLNARVGSLVDAIVPQGNTKVALDLVLPLSAGMEPLIDGNATLNQAGLNVKALDLWINNIDGLLKFNEHGIYSDTIKAVALNYPVRIHIDNADSQTILHASGRAGISELEKQFTIPSWGRALGTMDYRLKFRLPYDNHLSDVELESDLQGVELKLPATLAKSKNEQRPLSLRFDLSDKLSLPITVNYAHELKAAVKFNTAKQSIDSGHILLGKGDAVQQQDAGLKLEINVDPLDLKAWSGLGAAQGQQNTSAMAVREIKIHSAQALWGKTRLGEFGMTLKPNDGYWTGSIKSAFAIGKMHLPADFNNARRFSLNMELLDLSALKQLQFQTDAEALPLSPQALPLVDMTSYKTLWHGVDLGLLSLQTERLVDGIAFKKMELNGLAQRLVLSGTWKVNNHEVETTLTGHLDMPYAGQLLTQLGITKDLMETAGKADFSIHWNAAPQQFSLAGAQGGIDINFTDGRILSIEPGFGRVLGVVAMAQWVKRLQLDFRDLYEEGLTFNTIKGHFDLVNGKAVTQDLVVDAIPAMISIMGDTDLINKTVAQRVHVMPKGADAVPIAGTIMDQVTRLIAQTLTGEEQEGFFLGSQYLLKGRWDDITIIPLHDNDGLLQKTWTGITRFPWLLQPEP